MSPEQARGKTLDQRSDLFSLGCVLYAMCSGRSPFRSSTIVDAIRRVCDDTPRPIREVNSDIPGELTLIIDRLLAKSPADRFQNASEVAELLGAHLAHIQQPGDKPMPSISHPMTRPSARSTRTLMRWTTSIGAAMLLLLCVYFGGKWHPITDTGRSLGPIVGPQPGPETTLNIEIAMGGPPGQPRGDTITHVSVGGEEQTFQEPGKYEVRKGPGPYFIEVVSKKSGNILRSGELMLMAGTTRVAEIPKHRQINDPLPRQESPLAELSAHKGSVRQIACSSDGMQIVTAGADDKVFLWRLNGSAWIRVRELVGCCCGFSHDNTRIITGSRDGAIRIYDDSSSEPIALMKGHTNVVMYLCMSKGDLFATHAAEENRVVLWSISNLRQIRQIDTSGSDLSGMALSSDASLLATYSDPAQIQLWDVDSGQTLHTIKAHAPGTVHFAFSPDNSVLASGGIESGVYLWDTRTGSCLDGFGQARWEIKSLAYSPDGQWLATGCGDQSVKMWNIHDRSLLNNFHADWGDVSALTFSPDGKTLLTGSSCHVVRLWATKALPGPIAKSSPLRLAPPLVIRPYGSHIIFTMSIGDSMLAVPFYSNYVFCFDIDSHDVFTLETGKKGMFKGSVKFLSDNKTLVTAEKNTLSFWDVNTRVTMADHEIRHGRNATPVDISFDDRVIVTFVEPKTAVLWDVATRMSSRAIVSGHGNISFFRFSPTSPSLAIGTSQGVVLLYDTSEPESAPRILQHGAFPIEWIAFSADGKSLASADRFACTRIWSVPDGNEIKRLDCAAETLAMSQDGAILSIGHNSEDQTTGLVTLWDTKTWKPLTTWQEPGSVDKVQFAPDGKLAVLSDASYVSVWDVPAFLKQLGLQR